MELLRDLRNRENLDIYIAILLGIVIALLGVFGFVKFQILASTILFTLSFVLFASLVNRKTIQLLENSIKGSKSSGLLTSAYTLPDENTKARIRNASEICLSGISLFRFIPLYQPDIEEAINNGAKVKILLSQPSGAATQMCTYRSSTRTSAEVTQQRIESIIDLLKNISKKLPDGAIKIRLHDYLAPYSILILNPRDKRAKAFCHARLLPFRESSLKAPLIIPDPIVDSYWFDFINSQFTLMWEASKPTSDENFSSKIK